MKSRCFVLTIALALLFAGDVPVRAEDSGIVLIHAGTLLAVPGEPAQRDRTVVIRGDRIEEVRSGFVAAREFDGDAEIIDLREYFVLPGLMDMHTHLGGQLGPQRKLERVTLSKVDSALRATVYARRTLEAGFTTVRNLGGDPEVTFGLRDAIEKGYVPGPRVYAAGYAISGTGGHADTHGYRLEILDLYPDPGICDGADDCRRAVRALVKSGADVIKITATGGVLSDVATGTGQQLFDDELEAIVQTAHMLGRKIAAHAHQADGINAALRAGVDSIDHGSLSDEQSIKLFKKSGAYLVPTLLAGHTVEQTMATSDFIPEATRTKAEKLFGAADRSLARAYRAGVKIAFGTDSGVSAHGQNAKEFSHMVAAGMSEMDAIAAATVSAAALLGKSADLGSIEAGKWADIVAVRNDPLADIAALEDVYFVMKAGRIYKQ